MRLRKLIPTPYPPLVQFPCPLYSPRDPHCIRLLSLRGARAIRKTLEHHPVSHGSATLGLVDLTLTTNEAPAEPWDRAFARHMGAELP